MLIGRNNFDIDDLKDTDEFTVQTTRGGKLKEVSCNMYPNVKLTFITAHRSKGLEAKNVIIINAKNRITGFPNQMTDDYVLSYVLTDAEEYLYAEERRLFYVAITRTKDTTYIITPERNPSVFIKELMTKQKIAMQYNNVNNNIEDNPTCLKCDSGKLVIREGDNKFVGCTNYPMCQYTNNYTEIIKNPIRCDVCHDFLVRRNGSNGPFYGCSRFPKCENTISLK
ncbi:topoisomerase DNA-binding C4 zinc finger domain-containing protein [Vallitalea maricola]|uniref:Uncharacterized protein n=1 Tax=Vallitalea maricola TaxID=3074433 RepID=A0ACB5UNW2_9FIRM|nr:hypothetical protein AN2V17_33980 [Vallitalea sp. AN17-2]